MRVGNLDIPARTALLGGGGLALLAGFALLAIYPASLGLARLDEEIALVSQRIEEQKVLAPIYAEFSKEAQDVPKQAKTAKITADQVNTLVEVFGKTGADCGLTVVSVAPDPESLAKRSKLLAVTLVMRGELEGMRSFLTEVTTLPFLEAVETVRIQTAKEAKELYLVLWLRLD